MSMLDFKENKLKQWGFVGEVSNRKDYLTGPISSTIISTFAGIESREDLDNISDVIAILLGAAVSIEKLRESLENASDQDSKKDEMYIEIIQELTVLIEYMVLKPISLNTAVLSPIMRFKEDAYSTYFKQ